MQQDLNDMAVFVAVVECGTFTAAAEHLEVGKSQVSQRIARLEKRLGMRLIQRTTRQQHITDFGQTYYRHCRDMLSAAERAQKLADQASDTAAGSVRAVCPPLFSELVLGPIVAAFMRAFPDVHLQIDQRCREVDIVAEGYDLAFCIRDHIDDSTLVARSVGSNNHVLTASPGFLADRQLAGPDSLNGLPSLSMGASSVHGRYQWQLSGPRAACRTVRHNPRLVSDDLLMLRAAAVAGHGVVALPGFLCADQIARGELVAVLPMWSLPGVDVHAVYPSRHGQPLAVRSFIEFVAPRISRRLDELHAHIATDAHVMQRSVSQASVSVGSGRL